MFNEPNPSERLTRDTIREDENHEMLIGLWRRERSSIWNVSIQDLPQSVAGGVRPVAARATRMQKVVQDNLLGLLCR